VSYVVINICLEQRFFIFISDLKILEGKIALYKRGYHILLRQLKRMSKEKKRLEKEVSRLTNVVQVHEDLMFSF